jgi:hypothetical protein
LSYGKSSRLNRFATSIPFESSRIIAYGNRQWNSLVISRPHCLKFLHTASERLITKPSPFPTSFVYPPDKLGKFIHLMTGSEWRIRKKYSGNLLEDAFGRYRTWFNINDNELIGAILQKMRSHTKDSILAIERLFES